jgi:hypothetical protein
MAISVLEAIKLWKDTCVWTDETPWGTYVGKMTVWLKPPSLSTWDECRYIFFIDTDWRMLFPTNTDNKIITKPQIRDNRAAYNYA